MVPRLLFVPVASFSLAAAAMAQEAVRGGDLRRLDWVRPFGSAVERAESAARLLLVKPILGGSNTPDPDGVPCGGKQDCDGSW